MGKREQFETIFRAHYPRLYYYALQLLKEPEASRDVVSETFAHIWEHFDRCETATLPAFLQTTVRNKCLDHLRHTAVHAQYADFYLHAVDDYCTAISEGDDRERLVQEMLDELPPDTRHVLEQCYFGRKKYREVAAEMGVCQETVKRHIMRALKTLRQHYAGNKNPSQ